MPLCYILVNDLKKKLNVIEIEGVEPSLLVQAMTCKPFGKQDIDRSTVWLMTFCWCLVIFGFSFLSFLDAQQSWACLSAVIMPSSHPTPQKSHLLSPSLSLPTRGKLKFWNILIHYNTKLIILLVSLCYHMNFAISLLTTIKKI